jgi:hypothetical protein
MFLKHAGTTCSIFGYIGFGCVTLVQLSKLLMVMHHSCGMFGAQVEYYLAPRYMCVPVK